MPPGICGTAFVGPVRGVIISSHCSFWAYTDNMEVSPVTEVHPQLRVQSLSINTIFDESPGQPPPA